VKVERRDFLFLRAGQPAVLSCEPLFMRFLDSQMDGTTAQLFENLAGDLRKVTAVRLTDTSWLAREDLKTQLDIILAAFRSAGGTVTEGRPEGRPSDR
jgi:hypothetical protein